MDARFSYTAEQAADEFGARVARFRPQETFVALAPTAQGIAVTQIGAVTPRGFSGRLGASAQTSNLAAAGDYITFDVEEPAESDPNMDGSGGGVHYVQFVLPPGRGPIDAPSRGPFSTGKRVLWGPHFGPARHVRGTPGDPYPLRANGPIQTAYESMLTRWGETQLEELL